jgi:serine/threonine-protein kinase HipA
MNKLFVYVLDTLCGELYWTFKNHRVSSIFKYYDSYLEKYTRNIDPSFDLVSGNQPVINQLPNSFEDSCPDRWGRQLISKNWGKTHKNEISEIDYLLGIDDFSRQGNLRYKLDINGDFLGTNTNIPKIIDLPKLLSFSNKYEFNNDKNAIKYLLSAGSSSLGGARPKSSVIDNDALYIAKFPHKNDEYDLIGLEWATLKVAQECGIKIPNIKLETIDNSHILLLERFDRVAGEANSRIGYISAMTLMNKTDSETSDYIKIAEAFQLVATAPKSDLEELYRRVAFNIFINNTDDHLRNHGFLATPTGWQLSPLFDVNPEINTFQNRSTSILGETVGKIQLQTLENSCDSFMMSKEKSTSIIKEITTGLKSYKKYLNQIKLDFPIESIINNYL